MELIMNNFCYFLTLLIVLIDSIPGQTQPQNQQIRQHLSYLASDELKGRYPGSEGDSLARVYIINHFRKNGLQSPFLNGKYTQSFSTLFQKRDIETNKIAIFSKKFHKQLSFNDEYSLLSESGSEEFCGEVVFIGFGIHEPETGYDDYSKVNLKNKIVICYLHPPKELNPQIHQMAWKYRLAEKAKMIHASGGKCAIFVLPGSNQKKDVLFSFREKKFLKQPVTPSEIPMLQMKHSTFAQLMYDCGIDLARTDEELNQSIQSQALILPETEISINIKVNYIYNPRNAFNVAGVLRGEDTTETIIIGAHYDHLGVIQKTGLCDSIYNGADDNASGIAVMLELARKCSERGKPACNLLFVAFGAEEPGRIGSDYFIKNLPESIHKIKAMLNFDMVGRMKNNTLYLNHIHSAAEWKDIISIIPKDSLVLEYNELKGGTDSDVFQLQGIPVLWFYTGIHPDVHKVTDEVEKINFTGIEQVNHFSSNLINLISNKKTKLTFQADIGFRYQLKRGDG
jgi:hypothetical protein